MVLTEHDHVMIGYYNDELKITLTVEIGNGH
jgi:hypothetical protein